MKKFYFVGVIPNDINNNDLKFVDSVDYATKTATWGTIKELRDKGKKPKKFMTKTSANDLAFGLCMNFNVAFVIDSLIDFSE